MKIALNIGLAALLVLAVAGQLAAQQSISNAAGATVSPKKQTAEEFLDATDTARTNTGNPFDQFDTAATNKEFIPPAPDEIASDTNSLNLITAAKNGDAASQTNLGVAYATGAGVPQDYTEAAKWYYQAAVQSNVFAEYNLGNMYYSGCGAPQDYVEAAKWYKRAAEQGNVDAQYKLGSIYSSGLSVIKDYSDASNPVTVDVSRVIVPSVDLKSVVIVPQDYVEAVKWYRKAAEQGNAQAQDYLAIMYGQGKGVPQDYAEAIQWFKRAAEQGNADAQGNLGWMYGEGNGVPVDYVEAYKWFNLAAAQGDATAIRNRDSLVPFMTADQIAEAQQLSRETNQASSSDNSSSADNPTASGTGFFITDDGYLISNYHVVKDASKIRLLTSAGPVDAKVVQVDTANDIALLKADGQFEPLPIVTSRKVNLGDTVMTVGFPDPGLQGFSPKLAKGEIASLSGATDDAQYFQISVPVQPGNSGGALVDERGNVVGIVSAKLDEATALVVSGALPENVNYAIKSSYLLSFLESVPDVNAKLKPPNTRDEKFSTAVKSAQAAAVLVLVY
jgi:TPR repeat protein